MFFVFVVYHTFYSQQSTGLLIDYVILQVCSLFDDVVVRYVGSCCDYV